MTDLEIHEKSLLSIINASPIGMLLVGRDLKPVFTNTAAEDIFGLTADEFLTRSVNDLVPASLRKRHEKLQKGFFANPGAIQMGKGRQVKALKKDGSELTIEVGLSPLTIGGEDYVLVSVIDISDRLRVKELEVINKELELAATRDILTGLPNRRLIFNLIENQKNLAVRSGSRLTIMFIDLDGFKSINDRYGHDIGDKLLCEVSTRLSAQIRKSDILGRLGGDEFLTCFIDLGDQSDVQRMADHLINTITDIKSIDGVAISISASIGVCSVTISGDSQIEDLVKTADELMYEAKECGKGMAVIKEYINA